MGFNHQCAVSGLGSELKCLSYKEITKQLEMFSIWEKEDEYKTLRTNGAWPTASQGIRLAADGNRIMNL